MDLFHPDDNVVVHRLFECERCDTRFLCNRAEPHCIADHPGQYHVQQIAWGPIPCESCETWREPYERYVVPDDPEEDIAVLYPPPGVLDRP